MILFSFSLFGLNNGGDETSCNHINISLDKLLSVFCMETTTSNKLSAHNLLCVLIKFVVFIAMAVEHA